MTIIQSINISLSFQTPCKLEVFFAPQKKINAKKTSSAWQDMRLAEAEDLKVSEMALTGVSSKKKVPVRREVIRTVGIWLVDLFAVVLVQQFSGVYVFMLEVLASLHFLWALDFCYTRNLPKTNWQKRGWIFFLQTTFFWGFEWNISVM